MVSRYMYFFDYIKKREMLTDALRATVNILFKESFYGEKKVINVLTAFFISPKNSVKIFLKWIVNYCSKGSR